MSDSKQVSGRPEALQGNAGERARIEGALAVGELLDEQALQMIAGGAIYMTEWGPVVVPAMR